MQTVYQSEVGKWLRTGLCMVEAMETKQYQHPSRGKGDNKYGSCVENIQLPGTETGATGGFSRMSEVI